MRDAVPKVRWIDIGRGEGSAVTEAGQVRIVTTDGHPYTAIRDKPQGYPGRPMAREQLRRKFNDCAAQAVRPVNAEAILERVMRLEALDDVGELAALLA